MPSEMDLHVIEKLWIRIAELERENKILISQRNRYREAISSLESHGTTAIAEEWVCVPATEWWRVIYGLNDT